MTNAGGSSNNTIEVLARNTPVDVDPSRLSVLSYNLLAPCYVRPIDERTGGVRSFAAFQWAEPANEVLDWEKRRPRLLAELQQCRADVIALQEVQFEKVGACARALRVRVRVFVRWWVS